MECSKPIHWSRSPEIRCVTGSRPELVWSTNPLSDLDTADIRKLIYWLDKHPPPATPQPLHQLINHGSTLGILCMTPCIYVIFSLFRRCIYNLHFWCNVLIPCTMCILIKLKIECFISLDCLLWPGRRTKTCLHISSIINIRCHKKVWLPSEGDPPDREEKFIKSGEVATSERVECRNYAWVLWIWEALGLLFFIAVRTDRVMKSPKQRRFFPSWQLVGSLQNPW